MKGKVYIGSLNLYGKRSIHPEGAIIVNVTSAQPKNNKNRRDFSPMTFHPELYKCYGNFEAFWQAGKVFEGIERAKVQEFWKRVSVETGPKRRYPGSKGKKVLYSEFEGEKMDYITSRKKVYVPHYFEYMKQTEMATYWKQELENENHNLCILDFDGPRTEVGDVDCVEVTLDLLKEKINDSQFPFGHGYVVAGYLLGFEPQHYT